MIAYNLQHAGYDVLQERDGRSGLRTALYCNIDLAIIDLMLPELDGLSLSKELARQKPDLPIIILTAISEKDTILDGFDSGADDYIIKPFDLDELLARIAVRLRKSQQSSSASQVESPPRIPELVMDSDGHTVGSSGGEVFLKPKEYDLLELLLSEPGHLFRREEIYHAVWHQQYLPSSRTLDVHIRHLRAKLESIEAPISIQNVRGVGYRVQGANSDSSS